MARKKNATFQGAGASEVDVDVATFERVIENVVGDAALIWDITYNVTAAAAGTTINHSGYNSTTQVGRGTPLGIPYCCSRYLDDSLTYNLSNTYSTSSKVALFFVPIYCPQGELYLDVRLPIPSNGDMSASIDNLPFAVEIYSSAFALLKSIPMVLESKRTTVAEDSIYYASAEFPTSGTLYFVAITTSGVRAAYDLIFKQPFYTWRSEMITTGALNIPNVPGTPYPVGTTNFGGLNIPSFVDFDDARFSSYFPISAHEVFYTAQNLNTIEEMLTGAPAGGQSAYSLSVASDVAFHDHLTYLTNDVMVDLPLWQMALGAAEFTTNTASIKTKFTEWDAPRIREIATNATGGQELLSVLLELDNFDPSFTGSKLNVVVLARSNAINKAQGTYELMAQMFNEANTSKPAQTVGFVALGTSDFYVAQVSGLEFHQKAVNRLRLFIKYNNMPTIDDSFAVVGASAYFKA